MASYTARSGEHTWGSGNTAWELTGGGEGKTPAVEDTAIIPTGAKITVAAAAKCKKLVFTGGTLKTEKTLGINGEGVAAPLVEGSSGTVEETATGEIQLKINAATTCGLNTTVDLKKIALEGANATTAIFTVEANLTAATQIKLEKGVWTVGAHNVTTASLLIPSSANKTWKAGSGTIKLTGTNAFEYSEGTIEAETAVMEVTGTTRASPTTEKATVGGVNLTWASTVKITADNALLKATAGTMTITTLELANAGGSKGMFFTQAGIYKVTTLTVNSKAGSVLKLLSGTKGEQWKISKAAGTVTLDYVEIEDSKAEGGATWEAGPHSSPDKGNNTGWAFATSTPLTLTVTQNTAPTLDAGAVGRALTRTQSTASTLARALARILTLTLSPVVTLQGISSKAGELVFSQEARPSVHRVIVRNPLNLTQPSTLTASKALPKSFSISQALTMLSLGEATERAGGKVGPLTLEAETQAAVGSFAEKALRVGQPSVLSRAVAMARGPRISVSPGVRHTGVWPVRLLVTVATGILAGRQHPKTISIAQAQNARLERTRNPITRAFASIARAVRLAIDIEDP